jgi:hypothetical protein
MDWSTLNEASVLFRLMVFGCGAAGAFSFESKSPALATLRQLITAKAIMVIAKIFLKFIL